MNLVDTIVAVSSPPYPSALGLIRLSGDLTASIMRQIFRANSPPADRDNFSRRALVGKIFWRATNGLALAIPAIAYQLPAPRSYTGENTGEFIFPGARIVARQIVNLCLENGARLAEAGEFSWRAIINGRMSVNAATAVTDLINGNQHHRSAINFLHHGKLNPLQSLRDEIVDVARRLEQELDFSDEELAPGFYENITAQLKAVDNHLTARIDTDRCWIQRDNFFSVGLIGATNAGKSALFNRLLDENAALVAAEKSTTRDQHTRELTIGQLRFSLTDCPGEDDSVDSLGGINELLRARNRERNRHFALALLVIDANAENIAETTAALQHLEKSAPVHFVFNKCDLGFRPRWQEWNEQARRIYSRGEMLKISVQTGMGIAELREKICAAAINNFSMPVADLAVEREIVALRETQKNIAQALIQLTNGALELAAFELRAASETILNLTGERYDEEILRAIFANFCVGK